jgi:hypothetical protein
MIVRVGNKPVRQCVVLVTFITFSIAFIVSFGSVEVGYAMALSWGLLSALILSMIRK